MERRPIILCASLLVSFASGLKLTMRGAMSERMNAFRWSLTCRKSFAFGSNKYGHRHYFVSCEVSHRAQLHCHRSRNCPQPSLESCPALTGQTHRRIYSTSPRAYCQHRSARAQRRENPGPRHRPRKPSLASCKVTVPRQPWQAIPPPPPLSPH